MPHKTKETETALFFHPENKGLHLPNKCYHFWPLSLSRFNKAQKNKIIDNEGTRRKQWKYFVFVLGFYTISTVYQSYNGGQLAWPHRSWTGLAFLKVGTH